MPFHSMNTSWLGTATGTSSDPVVVLKGEIHDLHHYDVESMLRKLAQIASQCDIGLDKKIDRDTTKFILGGNAIVYRGTVHTLGITVAMKIFHLGYKRDISIIKVGCTLRHNL
ncbi:hypothetical protein ID866_8024 [Astraeus odoratus]|nr:hypothetical protein ID866_8024 [Astraeus odoratus]